MALPAAWLAETQKANALVVPFLRVSFPSGLKTYAPGPVSRTGAGNFDGKITRWGSAIARLCSDRDGKLATPTTSAVIDDSDNTLLPLLESGDARGSSIVIRLSHPSIAPVTVFNGLLSTWQMSGPTAWELMFQYRDQPLKGPGPRTAFMASDWPNADATIYGLFGPVVYGLHDSTNTTGAGMVSCFLVDKSVIPTTPVYAVCVGWAQSVDRVFSGGVLKTLTTDYTIQHPVVNGRQWTTINFVAGHGPASTVAVTADVHGYEAVGDGTGPMLQSTDQIRHLLENFFWNDYQSGLWLAPSNTLATAFAVAKLYCTQKNILTSRWYGGQNQISGLDALAEFLRTTQLLAYWTSNGSLAISPNDPRDATIYFDNQQWIAEHRGEMLANSFKVSFNRDALIDRYSVKYLLSSATNVFQKQLEIRNPTLTENAGDTLELPWSQAA